MSSTTPARNLINGEWSDAGSVHESINPSTGDVVGTYVSAGRVEAEAAIAAARTAFDTTGWSRDAALRARALDELADRLAERLTQLARGWASSAGQKLIPIVGALIPA